MDPPQEAQENIIHFPEDSPDALRGVIMWLYGFELQECFAMEDGINGALLAVVLPQMYDLAAKYDMPELMKDIEVSIKERDPSTEYRIKGWFWPMARILWSNPDSAVVLRKICLDLIRD